MPGTWTYTAGTNTVQVTGGTSGAPATLADFVTADRAGTGTSLLAATAGAANNTLTNAVRPVEKVAIIVKCIVASKTTETDYIFITGTDCAGNAQTESIDVSAGNGTYTTTKYWASISNLDCSDSSTGGGTVWADGTIAVTQDIWGVIWDHGNSTYTVDSIWSIGNGSSSTYVTSTNEQFTSTSTNAAAIQIKSAATLQLGDLVGSWSVNGSSWVLNGPDNSTLTFLNAGTFLCYGSRLKVASKTQLFFTGAGTVKIKNSIWSFIWATTFDFSLIRPQFANSLATLEIEDWFVSGIKQVISAKSPATAENIHIHSASSGLQTGGSVGNVLTTNGIRFTSITNEDLTTFTSGGAKAEMIAIDPYDNIGTVVNSGTETNYCQVSYTCNIHVTDKDGNDLSGVVVDCVDALSANVWTAGTVTTDANGDIAEQTIRYKRWTGTSETLTDYSPHVFTFSKAGYKTMTMEAITVSRPVVWSMELQQQNQPPDAMRY